MMMRTFSLLLALVCSLTWAARKLCPWEESSEDCTQPQYFRPPPDTAWFGKCNHLPYAPSFFIPAENFIVDYTPSQYGSIQRSPLSCTACQKGTQYGYSPINPHDVSLIETTPNLAIGAFSCPTSSEICIEGVDGKMYAGTSDNDATDRLQILPVPYCDESSCRVYCTLGSTRAKGDLQNSNAGLQLVGDDSTTILVSDYFGTDAKRLSFADAKALGKPYIACKGFECSSCKYRLKFCDKSSVNKPLPFHPPWYPEGSCR